MSRPSRILVVYYSRTGTTARVAKELADALGADIEPITESEHDAALRSGAMGYLRCGFEASVRRAADVMPLRHDPSHYDMVVVGTPVWNASVSSPVRGFLRRYGRSLQGVALFCTCGGRGGKRALRQMTREAGTDPAAVLVLTATDLAHGRAAQGVRGLAYEVRRDLATRAPKPPSRPSEPGRRSGERWEPVPAG